MPRPPVSESPTYRVSIEYPDFFSLRAVPRIGSLDEKNRVTELLYAMKANARQTRPNCPAHSRKLSLVMKVKGKYVIKFFM
jgi:hypothetical protein